MSNQSNENNTNNVNNVNKSNNRLKKTTFKYKVTNQKGKNIVGYLDAYNKNEVISYLENEGFKVLKIDSQSSVLNMQIGSNKLKYSELEFMLAQLSTYLKAGIPLIDSIKILEKQTVKPEKKRIYSNIIYELSKGESFSSALSLQGSTFPLLLINMVRTAELTGDLTEILDDMRSYYESMDRTRKEAISSMIYPSILFIFAIAVLVFILSYVIPSFVKLFEQQNAKLPGITKVVLAISSFLTSNKYIIVGVLLGTVLCLVLLYK